MASSARVAKNTVFLYIRMLFVLLVGLYSSRILLANLGVVDYGLYNVIGGIVTMLSFINSTAGGATSRFLTFSLAAKNKRLYNYNKIFSTAFFIHLFIAIFIVIIAEIVGVWYFYNYLVIPADRVTAGMWVLQISIFTCLISFTQVPYNASLIAYEHMNIYALVGVGEAAGKLIIAYLIAISPIDKMVFYAFLMLGMTVATSAFYRIYCIKQFGDSCRIHFYKDKATIKMLLSYSGWDFIGCFGGVARTQGVNIILNAFFGPAVNAARAIAAQVENGLNQFTNNFQTAVRPVIIKRYAEGDIRGMLKLFYTSCEFSAVLYSLLAIPIFIETDTVLSFWLVNPPEDTAIFIKFIILTFFASSINSAIGIAVHATGDVKRLNLYAGSKVFIELPAILLFLYLGYPAYSAFAIMMISSILIMWVDIWVLKLNIPEVKFRHFFFAVICKCLAVLVIPFGIAFCAHLCLPQLHAVIRLAFISFIYWGCLLITVWYWGMNSEIRIYVKNIVLKKLKRV